MKTEIGFLLMTGCMMIMYLVIILAFVFAGGYIILYLLKAFGVI